MVEVFGLAAARYEKRTVSLHTFANTRQHTQHCKWFFGVQISVYKFDCSEIKKKKQF